MVIHPRIKQTSAQRRLEKETYLLLSETINLECLTLRIISYTIEITTTVGNMSKKTLTILIRLHFVRVS